ncbi:hypothetical protein AB0M42_01940 [Streptomyces sp. NPDC051784]|uniref:hypothetical protein n=1 Tax=Streptomyces sp. NPDC051784 TaxID=3155805 RepID=UPI003442FECC
MSGTSSPPDSPAAPQAEAAVTGAVGRQFDGGAKSGLPSADYVVDGATEEDVAADLEHVACWFSDNTRWRPADSLGGRA